MELTMPKATLSLTLLFVVICTVDAVNYLAFPRMGRSELSREEEKRAEMPWNMILPRKRGMLPGNFILPRKRDDESELSQEEGKRGDMPWKRILPIKRGVLPGNFILPRKRDDESEKMGYLAFPRMGRAQAKALTASEQDGECCGIGLKSEFAIAEDGKEEMRNVCTASISVCCEGLREVADEKPDGTVYSMCVPDVMKLYPSSLTKLKTLLSK